MLRTLNKIKDATPDGAERFLQAIIKRYSVLYPDWDLNIAPLQKSADENEQIDRMIAFLEDLRPGI